MRLKLIAITAITLLFAACNKGASTTASDDNGTAQANETKLPTANLVEYKYTEEDAEGETIVEYMLEPTEDGKESAVLTIETPEVDSWFRWVNIESFGKVKEILEEVGAADFEKEYNEGEGNTWSYYAKFDDGTVLKSKGKAGAKDKLEKVNSYLYSIYQSENEKLKDY